MSDFGPHTRRTVLKLAGATGAMALLAGCPDDNDNDDVDDDVDDDVEENDEFEIEPDTRIELDAQTSGWIGMEPEEIDGVENPTLVLQEGEEYEIGWEEGDAQEHNIRIIDEDENVVDDLETDWAVADDVEGDDQFLEFTASEEMDDYQCEPHPVAMRGEFRIESNGNDDEENDDEENDDEENDDE